MPGKISLLRSTALAVLPCVAFASSLAQAQTAAGDASEIIVTAQKRAESINKVPISISVLTQDNIVATGVGGTQKLEIATPGLVFGNTNGFAQAYLRGVGTDLFLPGQESPVGFYLDGVYLSFASSLLQEFGDIERIEVLKGPQGTLYGRNTTGGAVNVITRDPGEETTVEGQITFGTRGTRKFVGYASTKIANGISASISGVRARHDGFSRILNTGERADNQDQWGVRGKLKLEPAENLSITLSGDYLKKKDTSSAVFNALYAGTANPSVPGIGPSFVPRTTYTDGNPSGRRKEKIWGLNGTIRLDLGSVNVTSITGYRKNSLFSLAEGDSSTRPLLYFGGPFGDRSFTEELQLTSVTDSPLQWIVGAYYLDAKVGAGPETIWAGQSNADPANLRLGGNGDINAYAAFGQATYELTDHFKVIAGLRYSYEKRKLTAQYIDSLVSASPVTYVRTDLLAPGIRLPNLDTSTSADSLDPKITVQYESNGQLAYATFSKGFKSGSYLLISPTDPGPLSPEKITAYEVGGKHRLTDSGIRFNWALFHYKYKDIQVNVKDPTVGGIARAQNAASTKGKGVDVDLTLPIVPERFVATLGGEYLDVKYGSFPNASVFNIVNGMIDSSNDLISRDVSGNRAIRAPKLTFTAQAVWTIPLPGGKVDTTATLYHNSGFYFDVGNLIRQPKYNIANFNVKFSTEDEKIGFAVFINNAFNKTVLQGINGTAYYIGAQYNDPRIIGITGSFKL